jgi:hypothetical protein
MRKIRISIVFDVLPDQETAVENAVKEFLKNFHVNRIAVHRKVIILEGGEIT